MDYDLFARVAGAVVFPLVLAFHLVLAKFHIYLNGVTRFNGVQNYRAVTHPEPGEVWLKFYLIHFPLPPRMRGVTQQPILNSFSHADASQYLPDRSVSHVVRGT